MQGLQLSKQRGEAVNDHLALPYLISNSCRSLLVLQASMLEIYNEEYKDLLGKGPPAGKKHQVGINGCSGC